MTRSVRLSIALYALATIAGAVIGVALDRTVLEKDRRRRGFDQRSMRAMLYRDLKLNPTQEAQVDSILDDRSAQQRALMAPLAPQMDSIVLRARGRISAILTPEQRATYEQMQREQERSRRARQEKR